jgi:hypothetical protein
MALATACGANATLEKMRNHLRPDQLALLEPAFEATWAELRTYRFAQDDPHALKARLERLIPY